MTVLIAAAGPQGDDASEALADLDEPVARAETLADARDRLDAAVVVIGELPDGSPAALRDALGAPATVGLGVDATVTLGADPGADELRAAVAEARRAGDYRDAVDELYERCRAHAREGDDEDLPEDVRAARERADEAFEELADADDVSYSDLIDRD